MKKSTLVDSTTDKIIDYINNNSLKIGDKLPNEFQLASLLNVGRSTLRESIKALSSRNIIEVRRGDGTYISEKKGISEDPLGFSLIKDRLKLTRDLFDIRFIIEPHVASLAAKNIAERDLVKLEKLCNEVEEKIMNNDETHPESDKVFHELIAKSSGNTALYHLIPVIHESINMYNEFTSDIVKNETIESHREIFSAIKSRNPSAAFDAMLIHIANNRKRLPSTR